MSFGEKVKEALIARAAEGLALSVSVILIWVSFKVGPAILPALEASLSKSLLISVLLASLALNIIFLALFWVTRKKSEFQLKYGIYWDKDKNPHCPNCKIPIGAYNKYHAGWGYYCKPCKNIYPLTDAAGNNIKPEQAVSEL
ncbi:hypothetical protein [Sulfurimonas sp. HSL3-2]|uniref:hypothetical protein n=1 Tax=Hydrocurvibacter mobilis TaxID=3131936 RepID=UPI0031F788CC